MIALFSFGRPEHSLIHQHHRTTFKPGMALPEGLGAVALPQFGRAPVGTYISMHCRYFHNIHELFIFVFSANVIGSVLENSFTDLTVGTVEALAPSAFLLWCHRCFKPQCLFGDITLQSGIGAPHRQSFFEKMFTMTCFSNSPSGY